MSGAVLYAVEAAIKAKKQRIDKLEKLMSTKHISADDCKKHDELAREFNESESTKDRLDIAKRLQTINKRIQTGLDKAKHQNANYTKWMNEQIALRIDVSELSSEIATQKYRRQMRGQP